MIYNPDSTVHQSPINQHLMELTAATAKRMEAFMRDSYVANLDLVGPTLYDGGGLLIQANGIKIGDTVKIRLPERFKPND